MVPSSYLLKAKNDLRTDPQKRGFNTSEAAHYCGLSKSYFDHARLTGNGPSYVRLGGRVRYLKEDLDTWLDSLPRFAHASAEAMSAQQ